MSHLTAKKTMMNDYVGQGFLEALRLLPKAYAIQPTSKRLLIKQGKAAFLCNAKEATLFLVSTDFQNVYFTQQG